MRWPRVPLEDWMREYYFGTEFDLGCSGVEDYSIGDLRRLLGLCWESLDGVFFHDSPTLGGPALRRAIADRWAQGNVAKVMATHGSSEAMFLLLNGLLESGDEVVVTDPCYPQFRLLAAALGCRLKEWPLRFECGFRPQVHELQALVTPATRMVILNFPHNPTGASLSAAERKVVIETCARVGAYLVWDDAFGEITYEDPPLPSPLELYERLLTIGTLSKAYGLPGLRVGWCLGQPEVLAKVMRLRDYVTLALSPLVEFLAARVLENADLLVRPRLQQCRRNLEILGRWCDERAGLLGWIPPRGGVSIFPRLLQVDDVESFCRQLRERQGVLLVPGRCFGHPDHVRLGFGCSTEVLLGGLERLGSFLETADATIRRYSA